MPPTFNYPNPSGRGSIITLLTDFGLSDGYVGAVKGVILSLAPEATLVDIAHLVPPQDILAGALALECACSTFPETAIHMAVVDPGVGGVRRALACRTEKFYFIAPDNGILTLALARHPLKETVHITDIPPPLGHISSTFHARDVFAPAAAHLARGGALKDLGESVTEVIMLEVPQPQEGAKTLTGQVIHTDPFGNLITNITEEDLAGREPNELLMQVGEHTIKGLSRSYFQGGSDMPIALMGSGGRLEVSISGRNAAELLGLSRGDGVVVSWR